MIDRLVVLRATPSSLLAARRAIASDATWSRTTLETLRGLFAEVLLLATCERLELVGFSASDCPSIPLFAGATTLRGIDAARHVLRVAAGLDSRIAGETNIQGQVASATRDARDAGTIGRTLEALLGTATLAGRRVRAETDLGRRAGSYVGAAADRVGQSERVGVIGSGALAVDLVDALHHRGVKAVVVFSRHLERAREALAPRVVEIAPLDSLRERIPQLDALITATSSPRAIVAAKDCGSRQRPLLVIDLGVPANVDDDVADVPQVTMARLAQLGGPQHEGATIAAAEAIIEAELERLVRRHDARRAVLLAAHGAGDDSDANRRVRDLARLVAERRPELRVEAAFNLGCPGFAAAIEQFGGCRVTVIPVMTSRGYFVNERLPAALATATASIDIAPPVGAVRALNASMRERAVAAARDAGTSVAVIVVGHGTTRSHRSSDATHSLAGEIADELPDVRIAAAFLDQPRLLEDVVAASREETLVIVPFLLGGGDHVTIDVRARSRRSCGRSLIVPPLGDGDAIVDALTALVDWHAPNRTFRIGTRSSPLARRQTDLAIAALAAAGIRTRIVEVATRGDLDQHTPIDAFDTDGPFTDELERRLADGSIDLAVHSLKDLPLECGRDTTIAALLPRGSADESLVTRDGATLSELPPGARIGTSSRRRTAQLAALRSDLVPLPMRGAVDARLASIERGEFDGAILASAGIERLGADARIAERFAFDRFVPEAGQGAIAITSRIDDAPALAACAVADHAPTRRAVELERAFARAVERRAGSARSLIAAVHAEANGAVRLRARVIDRASGAMRDAYIEGRDEVEVLELALDGLLPERRQHLGGAA